MGQYLLALGHREIAAIIGDYPYPFYPLHKVTGFLNAIEEAGAVVHEMRGTYIPDLMENGFLLTQVLLRDYPTVTALYGRNDFMAVGAMKAAQEAGRAVPQAMSVIGHGDTILARSVCIAAAPNTSQQPPAVAGI